MATKTDVKRINVSGTVTPELHEFLENHRWANRMSKSDVINQALVEWGERHGFTQPESGEAAEAETTEAPAKAKARRAS